MYAVVLLMLLLLLVVVMVVVLLLVVVLVLVVVVALHRPQKYSHTVFEVLNRATGSQRPGTAAGRATAIAASHLKDVQLFVALTVCSFGRSAVQSCARPRLCSVANGSSCCSSRPSCVLLGLHERCTPCHHHHHRCLV